MQIYQCSLVIQNTMPTFLYIYALSIGSLADKIDSVLGMKPLTVSGGAAVFATIMSVLAYAGSKSAVKAAVLTKDGHHIRFHTYGPFLGLVRSNRMIHFRLLATGKFAKQPFVAGVQQASDSAHSLAQALVINESQQSWCRCTIRIGAFLSTTGDTSCATGFD